MCFIVPEGRIVWLVVLYLQCSLMVGGLADLCGDTPKKEGLTYRYLGQFQPHR